MTNSSLAAHPQKTEHTVKGRATALSHSRMWEQGNYTAPGICKLSIQADKVEKLEET